MRYAVIDGDGLVVNVIEVEPDNVCSDHDEPSLACLKWHGPSGHTVVPAGEGPNTDDPTTRPAGPGDRTEAAPLGHHRPFHFHPAPKADPGA